ncbi:hypothetical protein, partial [Tychonema sp. BBK16]
QVKARDTKGFRLKLTPMGSDVSIQELCISPTSEKCCICRNTPVARSRSQPSIRYQQASISNHIQLITLGTAT